MRATESVWKAVRTLYAIGMRVALVGALCAALVSGCAQETTEMPLDPATNPGMSGGESAVKQRQNGRSNQGQRCRRARRRRWTCRRRR
ncbi:hypothetical protein [Calditerricola satsumensis]|uniref:hypothetical protein n=1 Tax=Calditerricola satsumensis TaxID=373054 RepID=UPI0012EE3190|nr:hypothetical protein [Calditerricola satsumensis]